MSVARAALRGWRSLYGANPLHLLAVIGCFALSGYVVSMVYDDPSAVALLVWFAGAVIGHDLILYPLYAFADQPLTVLRWGRRRVLPQRPPLVPAINHVRAPVLGSAVLGLIYFPTISTRGDPAFTFAAGHPLADQYGNWLLVTAVLFLGSAVIYGLRLGIALGRGRRGTATGPAPEPDAVEAARSGAT